MKKMTELVFLFYLFILSASFDLLSVRKALIKGSNWPSAQNQWPVGVNQHHRHAEGWLLPWCQGAGDSSALLWLQQGCAGCSCGHGLYRASTSVLEMLPRRRIYMDLQLLSPSIWVRCADLHCLFFFSLVKCMQGNIMYEQFLASVKSCLSSKCFSLALLPLPEQPELHSCLPVVAFKCHKVAATPTLLTEPRRNYKFHLLAGCALFASSSGRGNVQIFRKQIQTW